METIELVSPATVAVRLVAVAEAPQALEIVREAARWSARFGEPIWDPDTFTLAEHEALAGAGELLGGFVGAMLVACLRLQQRDVMFWPGDPADEARYVHKLAVRRSAAGRGWPARLLEEAAERARRAGARVLRMDTTAASGLTAMYERLGFQAAGPAPERAGGDDFVLLERWL